MDEVLITLPPCILELLAFKLQTSVLALVDLVLSIFHAKLSRTKRENEVLAYAQRDLTYTHAGDKVFYKRPFGDTRYTPLHSR